MNYLVVEVPVYYRRVQSRKRRPLLYTESLEFWNHSNESNPSLQIPAAVPGA
jgi:hypothetical protein